MIAIGMFLVGCAENPALKGVIEEVVETPEIGENQISIKAPNVHVGTDELTTYVVLDVMCWEEESQCSLEPSSPMEQLYGEQPLRVKPGEEFSFSISTNDTPESNHIYSPDIIELTQFKSGEEKEAEVKNSRQITAPMETGKYYYSLKLQWDGELVGQAYYVFAIYVK